MDRVDYHIHYYLDACANAAMTFPNIEETALALGLAEIAVLKHYSHALPNGKADWAAWHTVRAEQFEQFLQEYHDFRPRARLPVYAGVETELVDDSGNINIPDADLDRLDLAALSVHYLPRMSCMETPLLYHPRMQRALLEQDSEARAAYAAWLKQAERIGPAAFVQGLVEGYVKAIRRHPKVRLLAHLYDGLLPLRDAGIACDALPKDTLVSLFEPLMRAMAEHNVLWELLPKAVPHPEILLRANALGVRFLATADAHFIRGGWGNLEDHDKAERFLDELGLQRGRIRFPA